MSQLDLITGEPVESPRDPNALTDRQQLALEFISANQPVSSDELGAVLHEDRKQRGGKGHDRDTRCDWCATEGNVVAASLRAKGLVVRKKTVGWCLTGYRPVPAGTGSGSGPNATGEGLDDRGLPEGF